MTLQLEKKNKTAVLSFGRHNPPTTGHEKLLNKVHSVAKQHGGTAHVVTSHSHDAHKNPVPQDKKLEYLRKVAHPDVNVSGSSKEHPTILHHASKLHAAGHKHLVVVAGGDREKEFHKTLNTYNGKKGAHGHYKFKSIKVVSSGKRDPDSHGTEGISGTKMRDYAKTGQHDKFKAGLPKALHPHAKEIHRHTGGTQLESFKEALDRMRNQYDKKKKFKPSGEKTEVIMHVNPPAEGGDKRNTKPGSPSNSTRAGGIRFGESKAGNVLAGTKRGAVLGFQMGEDVNRAFAEEVFKPHIMINPKNPKERETADTNAKHLKLKAKGWVSETKEEKNCGCGQDPCITYGKQDKEEVTEILSRAGRIKRGLIMRRIKHKVQRKKAMMRKKLATTDMLARRSRRHAVRLVRKRFMGKKGENYAKLGMADKIMIDKKVATKKAIIFKIAQRLLPKVRRAELIRLKNYKQNKLGSASKASSSLSIKNVKQSSSENFVGVLPMSGPTGEIYSLSKKDVNAIMEKAVKNNFDADVLFELFVMGADQDGRGTPQQRGFQSLNTFIADIKKIEISETLKDWQGEPIQGTQLDRRFKSVIVRASSIPKLQEFKATGERSDVEDPIDPKTVKHDVVDDKKKKKKIKRLSELEYPHETAKKYKKDTPGQQNEDVDVNRDPNHAHIKKMGYKVQHGHGLSNTDPRHKENHKKPDVTLHYTMGDTDSSAYTVHKGGAAHGDPKMHRVAKPKTKVGGVQNEDVNNMFEALLSDKEVKQKHDDRLKNVVKHVKKTEYNLNRRIKKAVSKLPHMQTKPGGVQNEDAGAMQRVAQAQVGQRDRLRQQHEREMEQMDNSEEKKKKREAFVKTMQGLKDRQQARKEAARARLPTGVKGTR